jgi:hypothetical protein
MPVKPTAQDMQDIHDFALQRGAFVKFWDQQKTSLIIARESDAPQETKAEEHRGPAQGAGQEGHEGDGQQRGQGQG